MFLNLRVFPGKMAQKQRMKKKHTFSAGTIVTLHHHYLKKVYEKKVQKSFYLHSLFSFTDPKRGKKCKSFDKIRQSNERKRIQAEILLLLLCFYSPLVIGIWKKNTHNIRYFGCPLFFKNPLLSLLKWIFFYMKAKSNYTGCVLWPSFWVVI